MQWFKSVDKGIWHQVNDDAPMATANLSKCMTTLHREDIVNAPTDDAPHCKVCPTTKDIIFGKEKRED